MRENFIEELKNRRVERKRKYVNTPEMQVNIRESLVILTGNLVDAILLNQLIYWQKLAYEVNENNLHMAEVYDKAGISHKFKDNEGFFRKTASQMSLETLLGISESTIRTHLKNFEGKGWITTRQLKTEKVQVGAELYPDMTIYYRVNIDRINKDLSEIRDSENNRIGFNVPDWITPDPVVPVVQKEAGQLGASEALQDSPDILPHSQEKPQEFPKVPESLPTAINLPMPDETAILDSFSPSSAVDGRIDVKTTMFLDSTNNNLCLDTGTQTEDGNNVAEPNLNPTGQPELKKSTFLDESRTRKHKDPDFPGEFDIPVGGKKPTKPFLPNTRPKDWVPPTKFNPPPRPVEGMGFQTLREYKIWYITEFPETTHEQLDLAITNWERTRTCRQITEERREADAKIAWKEATGSYKGARSRVGTGMSCEADLDLENLFPNMMVIDEKTERLF